MTPSHERPDGQPEWLQNALRDLPQEMQPSRDLWPEIAQQINRAPRQRWVPMALAASVVVSLLSVGASFYLYQQQQVMQTDMASLTLQKLESPYQMALARYETQWPSVKQKLDPETAAVVERNLRIIATARDELAKALHKDPNDQVVQELLRKTFSQEIDTYEQVQKLAQPLTEKAIQTI
jgi:hypothetical protein